FARNLPLASGPEVHSGLHTADIEARDVVIAGVYMFSSPVSKLARTSKVWVAHRLINEVTAGRASRIVANGTLAGSEHASLISEVTGALETSPISSISTGDWVQRSFASAIVLHLHGS